MFSADLEKVQNFISLNRAGDEKSESLFPEVKRILNNSHMRPDLWQKLLLTGITSQNDQIRDASAREYAGLFREKNAKASINDLLRFCMEDFQDYDKVRIILIQLLYGELHSHSKKWESETIKFLMNMKQIFQLPYSKAFTDGAVNCLYQMIKEKDLYSSELLSRTVFKWFNRALRDASAPEGTEKSLKEKLSKIEFQKVPVDFVDGIYERLIVETNESKLKDTLKTLEKWYSIFEFDDSDKIESLRTELEDYCKADFEDEAELSTEANMLIVANSRIQKRLIEIINNWQDSQVICQYAFSVLKKLPAARELLKYEDEGNLNFTKRLANEKRLYLFKNILGFFSTFVSGITLNLNNMENDKIKDESAGTYRNRITRINHWAKIQKYDEPVIDLLFQVINDPSESFERREMSFLCLANINPPNLDDLLIQFSQNHASDDKLIPVILSNIEKRQNWASWDFCAYYFSIFNFERKCPYFDKLLNASVATGNSGMITDLVNYGMDHPDETIRQKARKGLEKAGFSIFYEKEIIRRKIKAKIPEHERMFTSFQEVQDKNHNKQNEHFKIQLKLNTTKLSLDEEMLELKRQETNYNDFTTGKHVDLAIIDKQLEELTRKIAHLTKRKNELEIRKDILIQSKNSLILELENCQRMIDAQNKKVAAIEKKIGKLKKERERLKSDLSRRKNDHERSIQNARSIRFEEEQKTNRLHQDHIHLMNRDDSCLSEISTCELNKNEVNLQLQSHQGNLERVAEQRYYLEQRYNSLESEQDCSDLRSEIRNLRYDEKQINQSIRTIADRGRKIQKQIDRLYSERKRIQKDAAKIRRKIEYSEEAIRRAENKVASAEGNYHACVSNLEQNFSKIDYEQSNLKLVLEKINELETETRRLQNHILDLQMKEKQIESELIPVIRDLNQAKHEFQLVNKQLENEEKMIKAENNRVKAAKEALISMHTQTKGEWSKTDQEVRKLQQEINKLLKEHNICETNLTELTNELRELKNKYERVVSGCQQAMEQKDREAQSKSMLRRLEFDVQQLDFLDYCRWVTRASETYEIREEYERMN